MQSGVNDFRVARRDARADHIFAFEHRNAAPAFCQRIAARQADGPRANDDNVKIAHVTVLTSVAKWFIFAGSAMQ